VRIVAAPDVVAYVRDHGRRVYVWPVELRYGYGFEGVFSLHAALEDPGGRRFARFAGEGIEIWFDADPHGVPGELHLAVRGWLRRGVRAYWDGHSFSRD
jgi:hypothetical protein